MNTLQQILRDALDQAEEAVDLAGAARDEEDPGRAARLADEASGAAHQTVRSIGDALDKADRIQELNEEIREEVGR